VCACGQAPIHAVAVRVVGNDEKALFRMRGSAAKHGRETERRENAHGRSPPIPKNVAEHARPRLNAFLTTRERRAECLIRCYRASAAFAYSRKATLQDFCVPATGSAGTKTRRIDACVLAALEDDPKQRQRP